jgi:hypothetical protein
MTTDVATPTTYVFLALTPHFWGKAPTEQRALAALYEAAGHSWVKKYGYVIFSVHPKTEIDPVDGSLLYPKGEKPVKLIDKQKKKH